MLFAPLFTRLEIETRPHLELVAENRQHFWHYFRQKKSRNEFLSAFLSLSCEAIYCFHALQTVYLVVYNLEFGILWEWLILDLLFFESVFDDILFRITQDSV